MWKQERLHQGLQWRLLWIDQQHEARGRLPALGFAELPDPVQCYQRFQDGLQPLRVGLQSDAQLGNGAPLVAVLARCIQLLQYLQSQLELPTRPATPPGQTRQ